MGTVQDLLGMDRENRGVRGVRTFLDEVVAEMRKTSWPTRQELVQSTVVVIISVLMVGLFVAVCDNVLLVLLKWIIPSS